MNQITSPSPAVGEYHGGMPEVPDKVAAVRTRGSFNAALDSFFFVFAGLAAIWLAVLVFDESFALGWGAIWVAVIFWLLLAYLVLPRLHRILTHIYVPDYFFGRTRTSDGLLGDPVNLAVDGDEPQIHEAMLAAGWTRADDLSLASSRRIVLATMLRRSYNEAPVSPLYLFGRTQDFAYQQEVLNNPAKRHHVRFWKCPDGWLLPGGHRVGWLAAGTFDKSVGFSLFTLQVTHKIDANTDIERDHIVQSVLAGNSSAGVHVLRDFSTGYHSRNGGGDSIQTDGDLPIIDVTEVPVAPAVPVVPAVPDGVATQAQAAAKAPRAIGIGAIMMAARTLSGFILIAAALTQWAEFRNQLLLTDENGRNLSTDQADAVLAVLLSLYGVALILYLLLVFFIWKGSNWARIVAMAGATFSIVVAFVGYWRSNEEITLRTTLLSLALDILVLLALSSTAARAYARRPRVSRRSRAAPGSAPGSASGSESATQEMPSATP